MRKIMKFIKSHKWLYKLIRPIAGFLSNKFYACRVLVTLYIRPQIRKLTGRKGTSDLLKFHNIHKGERIFIVMPGPSLREEDVLKLKDEITISVNGVVDLVESVGWRSTYYCIGDEGVYLRERNKINNAGYKDVFMNILYLKKYESEFTFKPHYYDIYRTFTNIWVTFFKGEMCTKMDFSDDIYLKGIYAGGRSIATVAVQIAVYMGASEIYLLGQDCDYSGPKHYFNDAVLEHMLKNPSDNDVYAQTMFAFYRNARKYCEQHNIKLYNATRGGRLEELVRVDFDELMEK